MLKAILLDIDGTLLDSNDAHARAWQQALREHGHDIAYDTLRPMIGKGGDKLLAEIVGIDAASEAGRQISNTRRSLFAEQHLARLEPTPGARDLLLRFSQDGLRLVIATSSGGEEVQALLEQAGVHDLINAAASSSDAAASKPDPDIVEAALKIAGLTPDEVVMLGDTPYDIEAAMAAGVECVAVRCGGWWTDAHLTGALAIFDDPADLLQHIEAAVLRRGPG